MDEYPEVPQGKLLYGEETPDPDRKAALNYRLHLLLGPKHTVVCLDCPLHPRSCLPARRFVSGFTLTSPLCVSFTP